MALAGQYVLHAPARVGDASTWAERAACRRWPHLFEGSQRSATQTPAEEEQAALNVCAGCPVVAPCLEEAVQMEAGAALYRRWTVRGGMTPFQRWAADPATKDTPKGHCARGHRLTDTNTDGKRRCKTCRRQDKRQAREATKTKQQKEEQ